MYLTEDYTGSSSKLLYARKGDKVKILRQDDDVYLVATSIHKFHIHKNYLSNEPIKPETKKDIKSGKRR